MVLKAEKVPGRDDVVAGKGVDGRTVRGRRDRYGQRGLRECCEKRLQGQIITQGPQMAKILKDAVNGSPPMMVLGAPTTSPPKPKLGGGEAGY